MFRPGRAPVPGAGLQAELATELAGADAFAPEWESLAVAASKPVAAASWVLMWWRHVAPAAMAARVVAVRDAGSLIGVAPFYLAARRLGAAEYRLMADDFGVSMEPLSLPGREREVAGAVAALLAATEPRADVYRFGPMPIRSPWVGALQEAIPGRIRALVRRPRTEAAPVVHLREPSFERWFETLGPKLRHDLRRSERRFRASGGTVRWADARTLRADAEVFARLHAGRWASLGWSRLSDLGERLPRWLVELGEPLIEDGRFGLCVLEIGGEPICADLNVSAGTEVAGVNSGWDQRWSKLGPGKLALLQVIASAYAKGAARVSLGNGPVSSQVRIANGDDPVGWTSLLAPTPRMPLAYAALAPELARSHARRLRARLRASRAAPGVARTARRSRR